MNRQQSQTWEGNYVKWDNWSFKESYIDVTHGKMLHAKELIGTIWYLKKATKGGMCVICRDNGRQQVSVPPSDLSEWENP